MSGCDFRPAAQGSRNRRRPALDRRSAMLPVHHRSRGASVRVMTLACVLATMAVSAVAVPAQAAHVPVGNAIIAPRNYAPVHGVAPVTLAADPDLVSVQLDDGPVVDLAGAGPWTTTVDLSGRPSGKQSF